MKSSFYAVICMVLFAVISPAESATTIYYQDFDDGTYQDGDTFGNLSGLKNANNMGMYFAGGTVVDLSGNKMLKLAGSFPDLDTAAGILIDLNNNFLQQISFTFYFEYITATQDPLITPTTVQAELLSVGQGNKVTSTPLYLLNLNYNGIQQDLMDVSSDPSGYNDPLNSQYSVVNRASYTVDLAAMSEAIANAGNSIALVLSVLYPDFDDQYDASIYIDDLNVTAVPEPSVIAFCFFGGLLTLRIAKKIRS